MRAGPPRRSATTRVREDPPMHGAGQKSEAAELSDARGIDAAASTVLIALQHQFLEVAFVTPNSPTKRKAGCRALASSTE